jgi:transposase-like protein
MSSDSTFSIMEFTRQFPNDEACLVWLWQQRYAAADGEHAECPKCGHVARFKRYKTKQARHSWTCTDCGHHLSVTAGTIFAKSSTSLQLWFYAIHLITSTRGGISAKQLERELGVNYKTAWRMFNLIRNKLMVQDDAIQLDGSVEADETWVGGKAKQYPKRTRQEHEARKASVFAAVERGGQIVAKVTPDSRAPYRHVRRFVLPSATLYTDDYVGYQRLAGEYDHHTINHSAKVYVSGDVHTQTIEGFFGNMKTGIRGTYHSVSRDWLQGYLNEYVWRHNHRGKGEQQFFSLLLRAASTRG